MRCLLISSFCAASHVGSVASAFVMRRLGVDVCVLPTTLFGRHPGWGAPGGGVTDPAQLRSMWEGVRAQMSEHGLHFSAVMTGYMGATEHVALAADIIDALSPAHVLVDPVMGDWGDWGDWGDEGDGGLYVPEDRAEAICDLLVPRAQIVTPNAWEWRYITGSLDEPRDAPPRPLAGTRETLVTSVMEGVTSVTEGVTSVTKGVTTVTDGARIGAICFHAGDAHSVMHERFDGMPNGGGDALAGAYLARRLLGLEPGAALQRSVGEVFALMRRADALDAGELPLARAQDVFDGTDPLPLQSKAI